MAFTEVDQLSVNTIRALSIDGVEKADSGHPGLPMGAAPMAYVLWNEVLHFSPKNPNWLNRDRFVLSAGHGSMLLYSLLHLYGFDVTIEDLKSFRQWGSKTPGHPEFGHTQGVDATTGPLGQGISMAVGMAMAERYLAAKYNKPDYEIINHHTFVLAGDGDMMEGVQAEAASLAGHLGLNRLIVLYDSNDVSLDGPLNWSMTESVADRYKAYGWNVLRVEDGTNLDDILAAILKAKQETQRPTLIEVKTIIGYGAPNKQGTSKAHGSPLGAEEAAKAKQSYGWTYPDFTVPDEVKNHLLPTVSRKVEMEEKWTQDFEAYGHAYPEDAQKLIDGIERTVHMNWDEVLPRFTGGVATRDAFAKVLNAVAPHIPNLLGGSADLSGSNKTIIEGEDRFERGSYHGRNFFYGVREHAMGAVLNGLALHGGVIPFGGTFLVFCDYLRPAIRLSALMKQPVTYIFTHDSIAVGEDGPTHEPIEQIPSLRVIPNLDVWRPADGTETGESFRASILRKDGPSALALSRQKLPTLEEVMANRASIKKGGYVLFQQGKGDQLILMASGSEVSLVLEAGKKLAAEGVAVRVVSMPCLDVFDKQDVAYKESVLPEHVAKRFAVEMAQPQSWYKYVGRHGMVLGIDGFGASAPADIVMKEYGFTVENVYSLAKELL